MKNENGTETRQLTVQLYNNSKLDTKQVENFKKETTKDFMKIYSQDGGNANLIFQDVTEPKGDFLVTLTDVVGNNIYNNEGEVVAKAYPGGKTGELGQTQKNSFEITATVDGTKRSNSAMSRSFSHEAGHTTGLEHPWTSTNDVSDIKQGAPGVKDSTVKNNLLNSDQNPKESNRSTSGTSLTPGQFKSMDNLIKTQHNDGK